MQAIFLQALDPIAETTADRNSYGFRKERSCADAIEQCFVTLSRRNSAQWVLEGDIKACFDRISHDWLLDNIPLGDKAILRKWLKSGYMEKLVLHPTEDGTPQGGIISPVLANLTLDGLETLLRKHYPSNRKKTRAAKVNLVRYADDFVITGSSKELLESQVKPMISAFFAERGLELSAEKTTITHIEDGFDFLGQTVRKYDGKLIIKPSKKNVASFLANIREVIKGHKAITAALLIHLLNPKIKGWAAYHRHICAKKTFSQVDSAIFKTLWHWCVRRHPKKGKRWIARKYFTTVPGEGGGNHWTFFGEIKRTDGSKKLITLFAASCVRIRRHIKIRGDVNPYAPKWAEYLVKRHSREEYRSTPARGSN